MEAQPTPGFGELDQDLEDDFAAYLRPKAAEPPPADAPEAQPSRKPAKKTAKKASVKTKASPAKGKKAAQRPPAPAESPEPPPGGPTAADAPQKGSERPPRRRRGRPPLGGASAALVLWTPVSIRARMQRVRADRGTLYLDQVLDALEGTVDTLADLVDAADERPQIQGRLFAREAHVEAASSEPRKQLTIRGVTPSQLAVIDDLVETTGAGSRSKLVNLALDQVLPRL